MLAIINNFLEKYPNCTFENICVCVNGNTLNLSDMKIGDEEMEIFYNELDECSNVELCNLFRKITHINLTNTNISLNGVNKLMTITKLCNLFDDFTEITMHPNLNKFMATLTIEINGDVGMKFLEKYNNDTFYFPICE